MDPRPLPPETGSDHAAIDGVMDAFFRARGMKTTQLVRTPGSWRISALAWDDERDGLQPPERLPED
jgi:hypothetical protein